MTSRSVATNCIVAVTPSSLYVGFTQRLHRNRIIRLMQAEGLEARVRKRYRSTTMSEHDQPIAANILNREFEAKAPNQRWVGDTTELLTASGKFFLAAT